MSTTPPDKRRGADGDVSGWYRMTGLGVEFIAAVGLLGGIGWWADRRFDTSPLWLLVGGGLGFAVGLWTVIRVAMKSFK